MLMPSIFGENLFDDLFDSFPFYDNATKDVEKKLYGRKAAHMMKTDIKEKSDGYELVMDLPGFTKDEVQVTLQGLSTGSAANTPRLKERFSQERAVMTQEL